MGMGAGGKLSEAVEWMEWFSAASSKSRKKEKELFAASFCPTFLSFPYNKDKQSSNDQLEISFIHYVE